MSKKLGKSYLKAVSLILCITLVVLVASPTFATPIEDNYDEKKQNEAIETLEKYLTLTETGNIVLEAPKRVIKKIDRDNYQSLLAGLEITNRMIDNGYLKSDANFNITVTEKYLESNNQLRAEGNTVYLVDSSSENTILSSGNQRGVEWYWWGFYFYLSHDDCRTLKLEGGALALAASFIPDATVSKVVAAALLAQILLIDHYDLGQGIKIRFTFAPYPIWTGIWSQ